VLSTNVAGAFFVAREALRASEAKRERLETALEELEAARAEATADAEHAWQQVTHKDCMLRVPLIASNDGTCVAEGNPQGLHA
jgi:hypothetical protein